MGDACQGPTRKAWDTQIRRVSLQSIYYNGTGRVIRKKKRASMGTQE